MISIKNIPISHPDAPSLVGVVLSAAKIILQIYSENFTTEYKEDREPVTIADKRSDEQIIKELQQYFPSDKILTEEHGLVIPSIKESNRLWIVDPIDGTKEFINRTGEFSVQIALAINESLSLGAVYQPTSSTLYLAAENEGCWQYSSETDWKRLYVSKSFTPNLTLAVSKNHPCSLGQRIHKLLGGTNQISRGGVGLKLMAIAKNEANYYINNSNKTKAWDSAAPEILFKEAGGIITDLKGNSFSYAPKDYRHKNGLVASCSNELHEKVLKLAQVYS